MRNLDFTNWHGLLTTLIGLCLITLIGVGIRLVVMQTIQQRRERANRQINERLRILIGAYKVLGGSFTGNLSVDPAHLRELRRRRDPLPTGLAPDPMAVALADAPPVAEDAAFPGEASAHDEPMASDRPRRMRDAVEAALSDILLLGTEEQVRLAARAASEMAAGRPIHTAELVVSLRRFIREVLDLADVPVDLVIPRQGPTRPAATGRARAEGGAGAGGGRAGSGQGAAGGGAGMGVGLGAGLFAGDEPERK